MKNIFFLLIICLPLLVSSQIISDNFEGNGNITTWFGDDCQMNANLNNPFKTGINLSSKVLQYQDVGGQYANVRFQTEEKLDLSDNAVFSLKVYVPSTGISGSQKNQISLKLQNGKLAEPWTTQSEIVKSLVLNQWQTITFDFKNDNFINLDGKSMAPTKRRDFDRIIIQINGENNNDRVIAYLDDVLHNGKYVKGVNYDKLIWSDEFDVNGAVNSIKWFHQTRIPSGDSWFNGEVQHYTDRTTNSFVQNGLLNIVAKKENYSNQGVTKQYTSARLNSKFAFKYGKVVMKAKLPIGKGTWPAFWTLGKNVNENGAFWQTQGFGSTSWPACGEIDIMEHWGNNQSTVSSATHTPSSFGNTVNTGGQFIANVSSDFNLYELEWTPDELIFSVNGNVHYIYCPDVKDGSTWPFDAEQYFLLNVAVEPSIEQSFTQSAMQIDYIRVYQQGTSAQVEIDSEKYPKYYPNPVSDVLNLELKTLENSSILVKIADMTGKLVSQQLCQVVDHKIVVSEWSQLPSGTYIVQYEDEGKLQSLKIIR